MKPYRVEHVQLAEWEKKITGLWLAEDEDWLLLKYVPCDYELDGYILIAKCHIDDRSSDKSAKQVGQVLKLKGVSATVPPAFVFADTLALLRWTEKTYGVLEFMYEEDSIFLGWLNEADTVHFWIDSLEPAGTIASRQPDERPFALGELRVIRFGSDYAHSLKLLWQHKQRLKPGKISDN
ncbi:hypothetical protein GCM10027422_48460 [Hymenobacter arcticus]